jgi:hypothetical protein
MGDCKHQGVVWFDRGRSIPETGELMEYRTCGRCHAWLPLGPARDDGEFAEAVAVEQEAARVAQVYRDERYTPGPDRFDWCPDYRDGAALCGHCEALYLASEITTHTEQGPYADQLAAELADAAANHIDGLLDRARDYAIKKLRAELEGKADAKEEDGHGDRDGSRRRVSKGGSRRKKPRTARGVADRTVRARATPSKKERVCGTCGKPGHNARSCGREADEQEEQDESPREVKPARPDRFADIEARAQARRSVQA